MNFVHSITIVFKRRSSNSNKHFNPEKQLMPLERKIRKIVSVIELDYYNYNKMWPHHKKSNNL